MTDIKYIEISIKGPVQSGKSCVLSSIRDLLESHGYCVAVPEREMRYNPTGTLNDALPHEMPRRDSTVFVLVEAALAGKEDV